MEVISLLNNKGGVSKSVSASSIASLLAKNNNKILLVDLDPQANLTALFREESNKRIRKLLRKETTDEYELSSYMIQTYDDNIWIIPGDDSLTRVIYDLYEQSKNKEEKIKEGEKVDEYDEEGDIDDDSIDDDIDENVKYRLRKFLGLINKKFDYVIIDNSPFYTYLTKLSLYASDLVLAPIDLDNLSYDGLLSLVKRISKINRNSEFEVQFKVFLTKVNSRTTLFSSLQQQYKDVLGDIFCAAYIRHDNNVKEASTVYFPVPDYAPKTNATMDYISLIEEVLHIERRGIKRILNNLSKVRR